MELKDVKPNSVVRVKDKRWGHVVTIRLLGHYIKATGLDLMGPEFAARDNFEVIEVLGGEAQCKAKADS